MVRSKECKQSDISVVITGLTHSLDAVNCYGNNWLLLRSLIPLKSSQIYEFWDCEKVISGQYTNVRNRGPSTFRKIYLIQRIIIKIKSL